MRQPEVEREFVTAMKYLRRECRLTQRELAEKLTAAGRPMTPMNVTQIETGRNRVTLSDAILIAELLNTDPLRMVARGRDLRALLRRAAGRPLR
jgi:transcriptional regulator with XRE-family HTH domain